MLQRPLEIPDLACDDVDHSGILGFAGEGSATPETPRNQATQYKRVQEPILRLVE